MVWNRIVSCVLVAEIPHEARWKKEGNTLKGNWVNHLSSSDLMSLKDFGSASFSCPAGKKTPSVSNQNLSGASVKRSKAIAVEFG